MHKFLKPTCSPTLAIFSIMLLHALHCVLCHIMEYQCFLSEVWHYLKISSNFRAGHSAAMPLQTSQGKTWKLNNSIPALFFQL